MSLLQFLKLPLCTLQVFTSNKSFADNPVLGSRRLNASGLHRWRCRTSARLADWKRSRLAQQVSPEDLAEFDANGLVIKEDFLPAAEFEALRTQILSQSWDTLEMRQGPTVTRHAPINPATLARRAPVLAKLIGNSRIASLLRYAAASGGQPIFSLQAIVTTGGTRGDDPQTLTHRDTFHSVAKAWFFLQDVGPEDGPFFYAKGSHKRTPARLNWEYQQSLTATQHPTSYHARGSFRIDDKELSELGCMPPEPVAVRANTLLVADTSGFHGRTPSNKPTLRVEVFASLRRNPFLPWLGGHVWGVPLLHGYAGSLQLIASRWLNGFGFRWLWPQSGRKPINAPLE